MKSKEKQIKERGITLIALVVTIIILLILAGVAIGTVTGDNGLFKKAKESVNTYKDAEKEEKSALGEAYNLISDELPEGPKEITFRIDIGETPLEITTTKTVWDFELYESLEPVLAEYDSSIHGLWTGPVEEKGAVSYFLVGQGTLNICLNDDTVIFGDKIDTETLYTLYYC